MIELIGLNKYYLRSNYLSLQKKRSNYLCKNSKQL